MNQKPEPEEVYKTFMECKPTPEETYNTFRRHREEPTNHDQPKRYNIPYK